MGLEAMREYIRTEFAAQWRLNDKAHQEEHFKMVEDTAHLIQNHLGLTYSAEHILFAAYFHDMFSWSRVNHHILSGEYIRTTDHLFIVECLNEQERFEVALACKQHRASYRGSFYSEFTELMNAADRETPSTDLTYFITRCLHVGLKHTPLTAVTEEQKQRIVSGTFTHMHEKYGSMGYARYPDMYVITFGDTLLAQQAAVDALTLDDVIKVYDRLQ